MAIIEFDVRDVIPAAILETFNEAAVQEVLANIANAARGHWETLAKRELQTSQNDYIQSIQKVKLLPGIAVISLVGQLANMIENGSASVDLREWLLGSRVPVAPFGQKGKRRSADGKGFYRAIPFRHQTPGTSGVAAPPMGSGLEKGGIEGARELGRAVYKAALKLDASKMSSDGKRIVEYGGRLPAGMAPKMREHKTDIYAGMIRATSAYGEKVQAQYMTFRTISTKVKTGWIRPATQGRHLAKQVGEFVARMAPKAFEAYARGVREANR